MKQSIVIIAMLFSINSTAQTQWKNLCLDKPCAETIAGAAQVNKLLKVDDNESNYRINVYSDGNNELQLWYTDGTAQLKRIVGTFTTVDKIYQSYFGRVYDAKKSATEGDIWKAKFNDKTFEIRVTKMQRENYYRLDIIERK
jgi:hypothetical protein